MVDIDDVLFPWYAEVHKACGVAGLHDGSKMAASWAMWEDYGCDKEAWLDVVSKATADGMYHKAEPIPGSLEPLRRLYFEGHTINLVTARGFMAFADEIREWTADWVEEWAVPHHRLVFSQDKVASQSELGRYDFALDDGIHNVEALWNDGVRTYLMDAPHNRGLLTGSPSMRVYTVDEFAQIVQLVEAAA